MGVGSLLERGRLRRLMVLSPHQQTGINNTDSILIIFVISSEGLCTEKTIFALSHITDHL